MESSDELGLRLERMDGKPYPAYKDLGGRTVEFGSFGLTVERVQGDPFAAPSRLCVEIDHIDSGLPRELFSNPSRRTGTENFLADGFSRACREVGTKSGSGKSGLLAIDTPGQEMLERSCLEIGEDKTTVRFMAGLPAHGRRIAGTSARRLLTTDIAKVVERSLIFANLDSVAARNFAGCAEDADVLRGRLRESRWIAFIANGAILPRVTGADDRPLKDAVPFLSAPELEREVELPNAGKVKGMVIPEGITLIVGGGYHGKSTLLQAVERGVYNHRPGDGRELVVSRDDATKVRAEDGRAIAGVDLSPFINNLPGGQDTRWFHTTNASGSTSQAAGIMEALEAGSRCLLLDEDISATNFLIRDERMQALVPQDLEPITPLVQRVRSMRDDCGISTVLVLGGSGDYLETADLVVAMDSYQPRDLTARARQVAQDIPRGRQPESPGAFRLPPARAVVPECIDPFKAAAPYRGNRRRGGERAGRPPRRNIKAHGTRALVFGGEEIDLSLLSQLVDSSQVRTIGAALDAVGRRGILGQGRSLREALEVVVCEIREQGLGVLDGVDLAEVRIHELVAAVNRMRGLEVETCEGEDTRG